MKRTPEPELMDALDQARAYAEADFSEPNELFVSTLLEQIDRRATGRLIDLGCGPGDICLRLARALPDWQITGLDAGPNMLKLAREAGERSGLAERVEWLAAHLPDGLPPRPFDATVSNSLLHHLPDPSVLWDSINALGRTGCLVQVMDLHRPDSDDQARAIVTEHAAEAPDVLRQDFYNSLHAAYTADEIAAQLDAAGLKKLSIERPSDRHWLVVGRLAPSAGE